jgi:integrase
VPRRATPEIRAWTAEQARAFLDGLADDELAALRRLALTTGMRKGELLALRWQDSTSGAGCWWSGARSAAARTASASTT